MMIDVFRLERIEELKNCVFNNLEETLRRNECIPFLNCSRIWILLGVMELLKNVCVTLSPLINLSDSAPHQDTPAPATLPGVGVPFGNVQYPAQPSHPTQHLTRRASEEAMSNHSAPPTMMASTASIQPAANQMPDAAHYDPGRPIPTQTYTNQSFHPMMAPPQGYAPISPAHVLPANMVVQPMPPRNVVTSANAMAVSGLSAASPVTQQANIYSLCLKMNVRISWLFLFVVT